MVLDSVSVVTDAALMPKKKEKEKKKKIMPAHMAHSVTHKLNAFGEMESLDT